MILRTVGGVAEGRLTIRHASKMILEEFAVHVSSLYIPRASGGWRLEAFAR